MKRRTIVFIISTILATGLAANYWWPQPAGDSILHTRPSSADYFISQVSIKQFDQQGLLINQLNAEKLEHFKNSRLSLLVAPQILVKNSPQANWSITAKNGQLDHYSNQFVLTDRVTIEQSFLVKTETISQTKIQTPKLTINLNNHSAQSDSGIRIATPTNETTAQAMLMNFKTGQINFNGQVQTKGFINDSNKSN